MSAEDSFPLLPAFLTQAFSFSLLIGIKLKVLLSCSQHSTRSPGLQGGRGDEGSGPGPLQSRVTRSARE